MTVVAVIPAYNEGKTIRKVLEATKPSVDKIVVIDDGSTDDTWTQATTIATHVIKYPTNRGVGVALKEGIQKAMEVGADWVVTLDADGEHDPLEIPLLLKAAKHGHADLVLGSRFLRNGEAVRMPLVKRVSNALSTLMFTFLYRVKLTDTQSGFRVYRRRVFEGINFAQTDMLFNTEILIASSKRHLKLVEVPIVSVSSGKRFGNHQFEEIVAYPLLLVRDYGKKLTLDM
jgi:glycosyltransferase involved in cell wall biosynthesis